MWQIPYTSPAAADWRRTALLACGIIGAWAILLICRLCVRVYWKPWLNLPGPPNRDLLLGHLRLFSSEPNGAVTKRWFDQYGGTILWRSFVSRPEILTRDPNLVHAALHWPQFDRGRASPRLCRQMGVPSALAAVHGFDHRRIRKAMMPAFGAPAMRKLWPLMLDKVNLMRRKIEVGAEPDGSFVLASDKWMGLLTVEVIHKCGFGDEPGCLETERPSVLESVVRQMYSVPRGWIDILEEADLIPFLNKLLNARKAEVLQDVSVDAKKDEFAKNDMVSILLRAQMASDISEDWRITDQELVDQVKLLLFAATATQFSAMTFALHYMATDVRVQDKLRAELLSLPTDSPSWEQLSDLVYLDAVVKETTRLWSSVESLERMVVEKVTVPLSEPVTGRNGELITELTLDSGTAVRLPMLNINADPRVYGGDAHMFRPERHLEDNKMAGQDYGGAWGNHISFSGGPQGCVGFRFAVAEIKALLVVILRAYRVSEPTRQSVQRIGAITGTKTKVYPKPDAGIEGIPIILTPLEV